MNALVKGLFSLAVLFGGGTSYGQGTLSGTSLYLKPTALPAACRDGDIRVDITETPDVLKMCASGVWAGVSNSLASLDDIEDVDLSTPPTDGQALVWDTNHWEAGTVSVGDAAANGVTKGIATFTANDFNAASGVISLDYTNGTAAATAAKGFLTATDWNTFNGKENVLSFSLPLSRSVNTVSIANSAADGSTKGAASFTASDFDASSGNISLDYTNGQAASGSAKGFLTSADWTTFNGKQATGNYITALTGDVAASGPNSAAATIQSDAVTTTKILDANVTNAKLANMAQSTIKGRAAAAGTGVPTDLTATQATAILDAVVGDSGSGGTKGLVPAPASGDAAAQKYLKADGTWNTVASQGVPNNISNYNFEINATGWTTYADAAQSTPVDGTGGSPTFSVSRSTTTPLRDTADLNLVKDAANRQGEGVGYAFTINSADKGHVLSISFDYEVVSGTYATGDMTVYVYDVTNSVLITPSGNSIVSASVPSQQGLVTFQTAINSTSYRLIFHVASTSASAYTLAIDNVIVGPQHMTAGVIVTDWVNQGATVITATTTPPTKGSATIVIDRWLTRRVGGNLEGRIEYSQSAAGTATAGTGDYLFQAVPTGLNIDSSLVTFYTTVIGVGALPHMTNSVGSSSIATVTGGTFAGAGGVYVYDATRVRIGGVLAPGGAGNANSGMVSAGLGGLTGSSTQFAFTYSVPIVGWGSNTALSTNEDGRVVFFNADTSTTAATTSSPYIFTNVVKDTHAGYSVSTGRYTVQVPGFYFVSGIVDQANAASGLSIRKNASVIRQHRCSAGSATTQSMEVWSVDEYVVGDIIDIVPISNATAQNGATRNFFQVFKISGPTQVTATESVNARYFASATSISGSLATVSWTTKDYDSHNAMSAGVYTVPAPGKYFAEAALALSGTFALNNTTVIEVQKNGTAVCSRTKYSAAAVTNEEATVACSVNAVAGDLIRVQVSTAGTGPAIVSSNTRNWISIARTGN